MKGITLIELMIALLMSSLILSGLTMIYLACDKNQKTQSALLTIQENSRISMQLFNEAFQTAGYIGCAKLTDQFPVTNNLSIQFTAATKIKPYKDNEKKSGSDAISIMRANPVTTHLVQHMTEYTQLILPPSIKGAEKEIWVISDCESVEIFRVQQILNLENNQIFQPEKPLKKLYGIHAEVSQLENNAYYVAKTDRVDSLGFPVYALYKKDIYSKKSELIEGVNDMKITYEVLENGQLRQKSSDELKTQSQVVGISIMLELTTLEHNVSSKKIFYYTALRE